MSGAAWLASECLRTAQVLAGMRDALGLADWRFVVQSFDAEYRDAIPLWDVGEPSRSDLFLGACGVRREGGRILIGVRKPVAETVQRIVGAHQL